MRRNRTSLDVVGRLSGGESGIRIISISRMKEGVIALIGFVEWMGGGVKLEG